MLFGERILTYFDDIVADLGRLIAIPSVSGPADGPYPYGKDAARAVDAAMEMAAGYGLRTKNVGYHAMHAEYGEGPENAVVMAHLDVVPPGAGWHTDPYVMTEKDGKLYGRGVMDDKGSAVVALHCLRALQEAGVPAKRKLRVVLGSSEETGMVDMRHYFAQEQKPDIGFTPDGEYGVCHCEKGHLSFQIHAANNSPCLVAFEAGTVANAVPYQATCELHCTPAEYQALCDAAVLGDFAVTKTDKGAKIVAQGVAAHASMPESGKNAASHLADLVVRVLGKERAGSFLAYMQEQIGLVTDGSQAGVAMSDDVSGPLTFNLGLVHCDTQTCSLTVDIRYPATKAGGPIAEILTSRSAAYGLTFELLDDSVPLYLPKSSPLVSMLTDAYEAVMGKPCNVYAMGGGTYAREMFGKGVAFGPGFPENPDGEAHIANEFVWIENLKKHAMICMEAMYRMLTAETI